MFKVRFIYICLFLIGYVNAYSQDQTVGLFTNDSRSFNGYTLFNPMASTTTYLIDNCGNIVNSWQSNYQPALSVYLLEDGNLLRTCRVESIPGLGGRLEKLDWDGNITWSFDFPSSSFAMHHDIEPLPNGNILVISRDIYSPSEAILAGRNPFLLNDELWAEKIIEIEPIGSDTINIVWEWKAWDHLIQDFDQLMANYGTVADHPELLNINYSASSGPNAKSDWIHANAISYNPELDQIMLCSRNLSEIYIIDHTTNSSEASGHIGGLYGKGGDILYRFGNPIAYNRGTATDRKLYFQHDAHWIPEGFPDEGKIILFNNQVSPTTSSVMIISPPMDSAGYYQNPGLSFYGPHYFSWMYEGSNIYSGRLSSAQQLPNGNVLICPGTQGKMIELNVDGNILWEFVNPVGNGGPVNQGEVPVNSNVFKCMRYAPDFPGFSGNSFISGDPIELNPWPSDCQILEDTLAKIDLKVFLQGPFNGLTMDYQLEDIESFPFSQPYNISPFNYNGTESVFHLPEVDIVDWIMVEYRDAANPSSAISSATISRQAAFLLSDGSIVGLDGISSLEFYNTIIHQLYIVLWHRNHLGILSAYPVLNIDEYLTYDFTTGENQVYNNTLGYVELSSGKWGMAAGDANHDQIIDDLDMNEIWNLQTGIKGYFPADFNMDYQIDNIDKNDFWILNINKISQVPF